MLGSIVLNALFTKSLMKGGFYNRNSKNGIQVIIRLISDYTLYQEALQREFTVKGKTS